MQTLISFATMLDFLLVYNWSPLSKYFCIKSWAICSRGAKLVG